MISERSDSGILFIMEGILSMAEGRGLTEDAARVVRAALTDKLTASLKEKFLGRPVTLSSVEDITAACLEFYRTEAHKVITDAIIGYKAQVGP